MLWSPAQAEHIQSETWLAEVENGRLTLPLDLSGPAGEAVIAALQRWQRRTDNKASVPCVYVDTNNGDGYSWDIARLVDSIGTNVQIGWRCVSAGLIIAVAGRHRTCGPHTEFAWHGSFRKPGLDTMTDEARAEWMARHTTQPVEWWLEHARSGNTLEFGSEQALSWGVVDQIRE